MLCAPFATPVVTQGLAGSLGLRLPFAVPAKSYGATVSRRTRTPSSEKSTRTVSVPLAANTYTEPRSVVPPVRVTGAERPGLVDQDSAAAVWVAPDATDGTMSAASSVSAGRHSAARRACRRDRIGAKGEPWAPAWPARGTGTVFMAHLRLLGQLFRRHAAPAMSLRTKYAPRRPALPGRTAWGSGPSIPPCRVHRDTSCHGTSG